MINVWSDVFSHSFAIFTFNMLLANGKSWFTCQKDFKFIYLWDLAAFKNGWLYISINRNQYDEVTGDDSLFFQEKHCYIHFQYVIGQWTIIFHKSKRPHTHLLMSFIRIIIMAR